jgi:hypothetical protein
MTVHGVITSIRQKPIAKVYAIPMPSSLTLPKKVVHDLAVQ